jgi:peptide/nickel transport system substrate-binding protein
MDRRRFLKGVGAVAGAGALAATTGVSAADAATLARLSSRSKRGGTLRYATASGALPGNGDPATAAHNMELLLAGNCYETLTRAGQDFVLSGRLATHWSSNKAATEWTFQLRKGVTFHNGKPLTSADVAYSIARILNGSVVGAKGTSPLAPFLTPAGIKTMGPHAIRFNLQRPYAFLPLTLSAVYYGVVPEGATTASLTKDSGSGPFTLESLDPLTHVNLGRYDHYWESGLPYFDGIETVVIAEDATRIEALLSGQQDIIDDLSGAETLLLSTHTTKPYFVPYGGWAGVTCFGDAAPFNNPTVMEAMKYAANRKAIMNIVAPGVHIESADVPIPPNDPYYPAGLKPRPYDPSYAKHLLKKAGHSGLNVTMYCYQGDKLETALGYKASAKAAGINVNIVDDSHAGFFANDFLKKPCIAISVARLHASVQLSTFFGHGSADNLCHFENAKFNQLLDAAAGTPDVSKQKTFYGDAIEILNNKCAAVIPGWEHQEYGVSKKVHLQTNCATNGGQLYFEQSHFA